MSIFQEATRRAELGGERTKTKFDQGDMAALVERNGAQANTDRHRSMVLASNA
jgi:hypothetical protein